MEFGIYALLRQRNGNNMKYELWVMIDDGMVCKNKTEGNRKTHTHAYIYYK